MDHLEELEEDCLNQADIIQPINAHQNISALGNVVILVPFTKVMSNEST